MKRALRCTCLPLAVLAMIAAAPASLLSPVPSAEGAKLREQRWWVKLTRTDGRALQGILVSYASNPGAFTIVPDEKNLLKHNVIPQTEVRSVELLKPYEPKVLDPAEEAWAAVKKDLSKKSSKWELMLVKVMEAKKEGKLDALIKESETKLKELKIRGRHDRWRARNVVRDEIMRLVFAHCEQAGAKDKRSIGKAIGKVRALSASMQDPLAKRMLLFGLDGIERMLRPK
jgi:hypothetical protein